MRAQNQADTEFAIRAQQRLEARKVMVHIDCGRKFKASELKRAEPLKGNYTIGDLVMYRNVEGYDVDDPNKAPGTE